MKWDGNRREVSKREEKRREKRTRERESKGEEKRKTIEVEMISYVREWIRYKKRRRYNIIWYNLLCYVMLWYNEICTGRMVLNIVQWIWSIQILFIFFPLLYYSSYSFIYFFLFFSSCFYQCSCISDICLRCASVVKMDGHTFESPIVAVPGSLPLV